MSRISASSGRFLCGSALALVAISSWRVLTADSDWLLQVVPDDSFYYLQIARNLVATGRSTFDGSSVTNGYHPLWMLVLSGLAAAIEDKTTLLRAAVGVSLGLHVCVALLLFRVVRRLVDSAWGWTAAACWLVNPLAFTIARQGTEAVLYALAALAALLSHLQLIDEYEQRRLPSVPLVFRYGVTLGLVCLARTEGYVVAGLGLAWLASAAFNKSYAVPVVGVRVLAASAAVALLVVPWFVFSIAQVGTVVQDSGAMKMLWAADLYPTPSSRVENVTNTLTYFSKRCLTLMTAWNFSWASFIGSCACLGVAPLVLLTRHWHSVQAQALRAVLAPVVTVTLIYAVGFVERQVWWLVLPALSILLVQFISFPALLDAVPLGQARQHQVRVAVVVLAILIFARWQLKAPPPYLWQPDVRRSQLAIEALVPASERVGCFNAGIPAYFGSGRVVALDGLVNHEARGFWTQRRLDAYLLRHRIRFIADEQRTMDKALRFTRAGLDLEELASYRLPGWPTGKRILWRVNVRPEHE